MTTLNQLCARVDGAAVCADSCWRSGLWPDVACPMIPSRGALLHAPLDHRMRAVAALREAGWTTEAAFAHIEGSCDPLICGGVNERPDVPITSVERHSR